MFEIRSKKSLSVVKDLPAAQSDNIKHNHTPIFLKPKCKFISIMANANYIYACNYYLILYLFF